MQLQVSKKISHSENTKNQIERIPVKESESPFQTQLTRNTTQQIENALHRTKLDLEIGMYWMLSKYHQTLYNKHSH